MLWIGEEGGQGMRKLVNLQKVPVQISYDDLPNYVIQILCEVSIGMIANHYKA